MPYWHRGPFLSFVKQEIARPAFRPFVIGYVASFALMALGTEASISDEARKNSPYHKMFVLKDYSDLDH